MYIYRLSNIYIGKLINNKLATLAHHPIIDNVLIHTEFSVNPGCNKKKSINVKYISILPIHYGHFIFIFFVCK